jgi:tetratricopeptide (TPR) repeat protein
VQFDLPDSPTPTAEELEKEGKYHEAAKAYQDAVLKDPKDALSWWALGKLYMRYHQKAYAIHCFEKVLNLRPDNQALADWLKRYKEAAP